MFNYILVHVNRGNSRGYKICLKIPNKILESNKAKRYLGKPLVLMKMIYVTVKNVATGSLVLIFNIFVWLNCRLHF